MTRYRLIRVGPSQLAVAVRETPRTLKRGVFWHQWVRRVA